MNKNYKQYEGHIALTEKKKRTLEIILKTKEYKTFTFLNLEDDEPIDQEVQGIHTTAL